MQDWLSYSFNEPKEQSVLAVLHWEKLSVPFKVEVDVHETVFQSMRQELTNLSGFSWQGFNQGAEYCIRNNIHLEEASAWIDKSINMNKTFLNLTTKSKLLDKQGKQLEADALRKDAMEVADEAQLNTYGYQLIGQGKTKEATDVFRTNVKRYPASWNVYDSLGEALAGAGDKKGAIVNYKIALGKAPDDQKKRIEDIIKKL